jgi:hypothetical protein
MRISDLNTNDQADDRAPQGAVVRTILSPPLFKYLGHGYICKFLSDIPRWSWWKVTSAREKKEKKKGCKDPRLEHGGCKKRKRSRQFIYLLLRIIFCRECGITVLFVDTDPMT